MKLIAIDLEAPLPAVPPAAAGEQWALVRLHGHPLGTLVLPAGGASPDLLRRTITSRFEEEIVDHLTLDGLYAPGAGLLTGDPAVPRTCPREIADDSLPLVTVAVCTRDRPDRIAGCLDAIAALDYPADRLDLLVVDNAPSSDATGQIVRGRAGCRYVVEPRPGLDWARNRAVIEAKGTLVLFTDDDVRVDGRWARAVARVFAEEPDAMAVTGLVVPDETDAAAQILFERYGGFGRGFERRYYGVDADRTELAAPPHGGTGKCGTGANMAFRREIFDRIGLFDPALDVGTVTNGGGDLEMFFRVIKEGHLLVYEPSATVRHAHRREYAALKTQLANNGIGFYAYLVRTARNYPEERAAVMRLGAWWFCRWSLRRLAVSLIRPSRFPRELILAELRGSIAGLRRYGPARARAREIEAAFGPQVPVAAEGSAR